MFFYNNFLYLHTEFHFNSNLQKNLSVFVKRDEIYVKNKYSFYFGKVNKIPISYLKLGVNFS